MLMREYDRIEDERGWIQDLVISHDGSHGITRIFTKVGAVRGNHTHAQTRQFIHVLSGELRGGTRPTTGGAEQRATISETILRPGDTWCDLPTVSHAWEALED